MPAPSAMSAPNRPVPPCVFASYTVQKDARVDLETQVAALLALCRSGLRFVELRDDLLDPGDLSFFASCIPEAQRLFSLRRPGLQTVSRLETVSPAAVDYALELGPMPADLRAFLDRSVAIERVVSCHFRDPGQPLQKQLQQLSAQADQAVVVKAALPIENLHELFVGHAWHLQNPARHVFLPIAKDGSGRFGFYRLLRFSKLRLNFVREKDVPGIVPDQPTLDEWRLRGLQSVPEAEPIPFAAILGDPVLHSRTPSYHRAFFAQRGMPVLAVRVTEEDTRDPNLLRDLCGLGLRAAAVTSPVKNWLAQAVHRSGGWLAPGDAGDPQDAGNTLWVDSHGQVGGTSTDGIGLRAAWAQVLAAHGDVLGEKAQVAVFGGGGLLSLLRATFVGALFLSARSGKPRDGQPLPFLEKCTVVVWSVGKNRLAAQPPGALRPKVVFDLNYAADSPGKQYAQQVGARYVDGSTFFTAQADAQQALWMDRLVSI